MPFPFPFPPFPSLHFPATAASNLPILLDHDVRPPPFTHNSLLTTTPATYQTPGDTLIGLPPDMSLNQLSTPYLDNWAFQLGRNATDKERGDMATTCAL